LQAYTSWKKRKERQGSNTREVFWKEEPQYDSNECNPATNLSPAM
jgi:hypothetical protein